MKKNIIIWSIISLAGMLVGIIFYLLSVGGFTYSDSATQIMNWLSDGGWYNLIAPIVLVLIALLIFVLLIIKKKPIFVLSFLLLIIVGCLSTLLMAEEARFVENINIANVDPFVWASYAGFFIAMLSALVSGLISVLDILSLKIDETPVHEYSTSENALPVNEEKPTLKEVAKDVVPTVNETKYEYYGEEEDKPVEKEVKKQVKKEIKPKKVIKVEKAPENVAKEKTVQTGSKIYHISKRAKDNKWAVKFEGGNKVIKLFDTQNEAREYVEKMAENQGGIVRVHKSKGVNKGKFH